jgi:hypothetical protein
VGELPGLRNLSYAPRVTAMRMRQSLAEIERQFHDEMEQERARRERVQLETAMRSRRRHIEKVHKRGTLRFVALVLVLVAAAVAVTLAMFQALYVVMG